MPKIHIPLTTDEAVAGLFKVKPSADMPRLTDFQAPPKKGESKTPKTAKKKTKK